MKIRVMGLADEIDQAIAAISQATALELIEVSDPYPNRGNSRMLRVYIEARLSPWCARSWHDGDCCEGSRNQQAANGRAGQLPREPKKQIP